MSENPFLEPDDAERTILRPAPGGRRATRVEQLEPTPLRSALIVTGSVAVAMGASPLIAAAAPLLQLLGRLRNTVDHAEPGDLRERTVQAMRAFEQQARDAGVPLDLLRPAHYAICASLDDVVLNTPWGSSGGWQERSLVATFHPGVRSSDRFFEILGQMRQNPGRFLPVLELMYLCLALGFQGRYRSASNGPAELDQLRQDTYSVIAGQRQAAEPELSGHWRGVFAPYAAGRMSLPLWVGGAVAIAALAGAVAWLNTGLNAQVGALSARLAAAAPAASAASTPSAAPPTGRAP